MGAYGTPDQVQVGSSIRRHAPTLAANWCRLAARMMHKVGMSDKALRLWELHNSICIASLSLSSARERPPSNVETRLNNIQGVRASQRCFHNIALIKRNGLD